MIPGELSPRQQRAITALLSCTSISDAAHEAGVGRTTLYRWRRDPTFRAVLAEAERQLTRAAIEEHVHWLRQTVRALEAERRRKAQDRWLRRQRAKGILCNI